MIKIKIINRGTKFKIDGDSSNAKLAKDIILKIYEDLENNKTIEPSDIHLYLMNGMNNVKNVKNGKANLCY